MNVYVLKFVVALTISTDIENQSQQQQSNRNEFADPNNSSNNL